MSSFNGRGNVQIRDDGPSTERNRFVKHRNRGDAAFTAGTRMNDGLGKELSKVTQPGPRLDVGAIRDEPEPQKKNKNSAGLDWV